MTLKEVFKDYRSKTDSNQVTSYNNPEEWMPKTQYGPMKFQDWCKKELERINIPSYKIKTRFIDGFIAIFAK